MRGRHISGYTGAFTPPESAQEGKEELETNRPWLKNWGSFWCVIIPSRKSTDDQVRKILQTRGHDFEVFDPRHAGVILEKVARPEARNGSKPSTGKMQPGRCKALKVTDPSP